VNHLKSKICPCDSSSNENKHALRNQAVAKAVDCSDKVIVISLEEIKIYFIICVAHFHHLLHVVIKNFLFEGLELLHISNVVYICLSRLRFFELRLLYRDRLFKFSFLLDLFNNLGLREFNGRLDLLENFLFNRFSKNTTFNLANSQFLVRNLFKN